MNTALAAHFVDKRQLLQQVSHRKVRLLAAESNPYAAALFGVVLERQVEWPLADWDAALAELDGCDLTVGEWLSKEAARCERADS
jgi:hypothetical protein